MHSLERRVHFLRGLCGLLEVKKTCAKRGHPQKLKILCFSLHTVFSRKYHSIVKRFRWERTSGDLSPNPAPSRATLTARSGCSGQFQVEKLISSILWTYGMALQVRAQEGAGSKTPTGTGLVSACFWFIYFSEIIGSEEPIQLLDLIHNAA